jgi:hypothetical protein
VRERVGGERATWLRLWQRSVAWVVGAVVAEPYEGKGADQTRVAGSEGEIESLWVSADVAAVGIL